jgi:hypothetical protein
MCALLTASTLMFARPANAADTSTSGPPAGGLRFFTGDSDGSFRFDTGQLRGVLRAGGKSLGLTEVTHLPTGRRMDRSNGLLSHYRVFTQGVRYGAGAWDWPSEAQMLEDGAVEVAWPAAAGRPFAMEATYRWLNASMIEVETRVQPQEPLSGFEVFLANYFDAGFTNAAAYVQPEMTGAAGPHWLAALPEKGDWLMFPRDAKVVPLIQDGRWLLEPHPVNWRILPLLAQPLAIRRAPGADLTCILMASAADCFALAMPHQLESHYSTYLSLFGRNLRPGERARARVRLVIGQGLTPEHAVKLHRDYRTGQSADVRTP